MLALIAASAGWAQDDPRGVRPGRPVEIRGEVVEVGCFLRDGMRGESHKSCALACLKNGGQLGIVEDGTGRLFALAGAHPGSDPSAGVREQIAAHVAARGRLYEKAGSRILVLETVERLDP